MATAARRGPCSCDIDAAMDLVTARWKSLIRRELNDQVSL